MRDKFEPESSKSHIVRVLLVDDHSLVVETVMAGLALDQGLVIETAKDIRSAEQLVESSGRFDLILLDYDLPDTYALEGLERMIQLNSGSVALFSGIANRSVVQRALALGASGFIPKTLPLRTLRHALRLMVDGDVYVPADFILRSVKDAGENAGLKPREMKVLEYLNEGLANKEIGRELGIEDTIVKMEVKAIFRKLEVSNRTQAVLTARKLGIV